MIKDETGLGRTKVADKFCKSLASGVLLKFLINKSEHEALVFLILDFRCSKTFHWLCKNRRSVKIDNHVTKGLVCNRMFVRDFYCFHVWWVGNRGAIANVVIPREKKEEM